MTYDVEKAFRLEHAIIQIERNLSWCFRQLTKERMDEMRDELRLLKDSYFKYAGRQFDRSNAVCVEINNYTGESRYFIREETA